jgi:large subunit ribosomal protein L15
MANELSRLQPIPGSQKTKKRVGRGHGSGLVKTSGRGQKGQRSRSSPDVAIGFEGGQMPLARRLPKRGFTNIFAKDYTVVNVGDLEGRFSAGEEVDVLKLKEMGAISRVGADGLKVLGGGDLSIALTIRAAKFTQSAVQKITNAGGSAEVV